MELFARVRRAVQIEGKSEWEVAPGIKAGARDRSEDAAVSAECRGAGGPDHGRRCYDQAEVLYQFLGESSHHNLGL